MSPVLADLSALLHEKITTVLCLTICYQQQLAPLTGVESNSDSTGSSAGTACSDCPREASLQSPAMKKTREMTAK